MGYDDRLGTGGDSGYETELASQLLLARIRTIGEAVVQALGGSYWEADQVADEVVAYVAFNWQTLRLRVLAGNAELWERHLLRTVFQRWLGLLKRLVGQPPPLRESLSRARLLALAEGVDIDADERLLFDYVFMHGFSLAETAFVFGLGHAELTQRLSHISSAVCHQAQLPGGSG